MLQTQYRSGLTPRILAVLMVLLVGTTGAIAQNLLQNPDFAFDAGQWVPNGDNIETEHRTDVGSTLDSGSGPGSLEVRYLLAGGSNGAYQEVHGITEGVAYEVAGSRFLPSDDNVAVAADIFVEWYDGDGYPFSYEWVSLYPTEYDTWERLSGTVVAPGGAVRARIELTVQNPSDDNQTIPGVALWDDVWFSEEGSDEAFQELFVPAAASVNGLGGTFWSTTGWFSNAVDLPVTLWGAFLPPNEDNTARLLDLTELVTISAHGFAKIEDLVGILGESDVAGGLYLEARASGVGLPAVLVKVTTHTFTANPTGDGDFGQGLPAAGRGTSNRVVIPGLFKNSGQRTNVGLLNTSGQTLVVNVEIWDDTGTKITAVTWTLPPYSQRQSSLGSIGAGSMSGGTVIITRQSTGGSFRAYTSTVDQKSGDAVYNPGQ